MIPNEMIRKGGRAIHAKGDRAIHARSIYQSLPWDELPRWFRDCTEDDARLAIQAVAADIWEQGYESGQDDTLHDQRGIGHHDYAKNPYRASETA